MTPEQEAIIRRTITERRDNHDYSHESEQAERKVLIECFGLNGDRPRDDIPPDMDLTDLRKMIEGQFDAWMEAAKAGRIEMQAPQTATETSASVESPADDPSDESRENPADDPNPSKDEVAKSAN